MNRTLAAVCLAALTISSASSVEIPERSFSLSRQFVVYCDDDAVRARVTSFVEETKSEVLDALGIRDTWKRPIIVRLSPGSAAMPGRRPMTFTVFGSEAGIKIEIDVLLGGELPAKSLQTQVIRALLLEFAYRDGQALRAGQRYNEPPPWLIEGIAQSIQRSATGVDADLFKTLVQVNRLPSIREFLNAPAPAGDDTASLMLYRAYGYSLLRILQDLPQGRKCLANYVADIPKSSADPVQRLASKFPALASSNDSLEKWWTLSMARLSTANDYEGFTAEETERKLTELLLVKVPVRDAAEPKTFDIGDFDEYLKLVGSRKAMAERRDDFIRLEAKASPLFRPILSEYQDVAFRISRGKTRGVTKRLGELAGYRVRVLDRMNEIADYLNWMEATQFGARSGAFEDYFRIASKPEQASVRRDDPISLYLDKIEKQMR